MNASQAWLVWTGALILALSNAVVLFGVAYNRQAPPDTLLTLTERELELQPSWMWREEENSGLSLRLGFRAEQISEPVWGNDKDLVTFPLNYGMGAVPWLDRDKLAALGFDVRQSPDTPDAATRYDRMLGRDVLLVLELDGPVHARALQAARESLARQEARMSSEPKDKTVADQVKSARQVLQREEHERSRLFIVDAGLEQATLRQRYPDGTHYAIVHGHVRPIVMGYGKKAKLYGWVAAVRCESINVPLEFRSRVPIVRPSRFEWPAGGKTPPFAVEVAFGRRLEPWIVSAQPGSTKVTTE